MLKISCQYLHKHLEISLHWTYAASYKTVMRLKFSFFGSLLPYYADPSEVILVFM